MLKIFLLSS